MFDSDDAIFADFADDISDELADFLIAGGNRSNFGDFLVVTLNFFGGFFDRFDDFGTSVFDSFAELHRVDTSSDELVGFS